MGGAFGKTKESGETVEAPPDTTVPSNVPLPITKQPYQRCNIVPIPRAVLHPNLSDPNELFLVESFGMAMDYPPQSTLEETFAAVTEVIDKTIRQNVAVEALEESKINVDQKVTTAIENMVANSQALGTLTSVSIHPFLKDAIASAMNELSQLIDNKNAIADEKARHDRDDHVIGQDLTLLRQDLSQCWIRHTRVKYYQHLEPAVGSPTRRLIPMITPDSGNPSEMIGFEETDQDDFNVVLVGPRASGKRSLFYMLKGDDFGDGVTASKAPKGPRVSVILRGAKIHFSFWIYAVCVDSRPFRQAPSTGNGIIAFACNLSNDSNVDQTISVFEKYAPYIQPYHTVYMIGTMSDVADPTARKHAMEYAATHGMNYYETSAKNGTGKGLSSAMVASHVLLHGIPGAETPKSVSRDELWKIIAESKQ